MCYDFGCEQPLKLSPPLRTCHGTTSPWITRLRVRPMTLPSPRMTQWNQLANANDSVFVYNAGFLREAGAPWTLLLSFTAIWLSC